MLVLNRAKLLEFVAGDVRDFFAVPLLYRILVLYGFPTVIPR